MAGIVVVAHENLAEELVRAATYIVGDSDPRLTPVGVGSNRDYDEVRERVFRALEGVRDQEGAILLADMYGGTPANIAMELLEPGRVEVITGVNLPMLVRLLSYRERALQERVDKAVEGAHQGIVLGRDRTSHPPAGGHRE